VDARLVTFLDAGRIGQEEGCVAVALHARTAAQLYEGGADWEAIAALKQAVQHIPVRAPDPGGAAAERRQHRANPIAVRRCHEDQDQDRLAARGPH
jgi:tRNA-dihydrouridine synthase